MKVKTIKLICRTLGRERLVIKSVHDAYGFINKQYDNKWVIYDGPLKAGTYAFVGGQWHNVKSLDPSILAHV